jgi:uroporphyrinogen-III decarboxylase
MMDMYRQPDKLLAALEVIASLLIKTALTHANSTKGLMAMFPLHKGADGWMSQKQFETFYWPSLKKVINALIHEGLIVSLFAEGSYNTRLESINEFPKGAVQWMFDQTDMARAKQILGGNCCLQGNVPSSIMITGTPREVKEYSRRLIETCGEGGGYILSSGAGATEVRLENLKAMVEAAREYGVYK